MGVFFRCMVLSGGGSYLFLLWSFALANCGFVLQDPELLLLAIRSYAKVLKPGRETRWTKLWLFFFFIFLGLLLFNRDHSVGPPIFLGGSNHESIYIYGNVDGISRK